MNDNGLNVTNFAEYKRKREESIEEDVDIVFECACGCQLYFIKPDGLECSDCGGYADGF